MDTEKSSSPMGQAWFCTTGLPTDVVVEVDGMTFHLHKFPLISKSSKLDQLISEQDSKLGIWRNEDDHEIQEDEGGGDVELARYYIQLDGFPGGSDAFEAIAKFCYGVEFVLTASTVVPLRCAGEFLGMTEEYSEDNLISMVEKYFVQVTLRCMGDSLRALKSCDRVWEIAERLEIPGRCIEAIVVNSPATDPALFGWPMADGGSRISHAQGANRRKGYRDRESWLEDLSILALPVFKRLISTMTESNLSIDLIETCLMHYAKKCIPGITRSTRKAGDSTLTTETEQRELLEMVISNLKPLRTAIPSKFLFGLLRTANILKIPDDFRVMLEKKISCQLDEATLDDLLIPSYSYLNETLYDVDCVERILHNFLEMHESGSTAVDDAGRSMSLIMVGKLIDGYLSEIASDSNLNPVKFYGLVVSLPEKARLFDDGLYRAVDVYLKAHPWLSEADREKISGILDCQKLTLEACTHAAQNERLPLRVVVQVLFFEQLQLRHAIAGSLLATDSVVAHQDPVRVSGSRHGRDEEWEGAEDRVTAAVDVVPELGSTMDVGQGSERMTRHATTRENQVLRQDMVSMRTRVNELERECSMMKKAIEKIDKEGAEGSGRKGTTLTRKLGCKFSTRVCDSQEKGVVDARRGGHHSFK